MGRGKQIEPLPDYLKQYLDAELPAARKETMNARVLEMERREHMKVAHQLGYPDHYILRIAKASTAREMDNIMTEARKNAIESSWKKERAKK